MQDLWKEKIDWDDILPENLLIKWNTFRQNLHLLEDLSIPRCIFRLRPIHVQCHGFADASLKAYGACIYLRATYDNHTYSSHLLCSKSKVAPIKNITLPRLELSAALLLAKLHRHVLDNLVRAVKISESILWSDFIIVLAWLRTDPAQLKMFVGNRVAQILDLTPTISWRHVSSKENPADIVSRGVTSPNELVDCNLWWHGPSWLVESGDKWPNKFFTPMVDALPERRILLTTDSTQDNKLTNSFFHNIYSKYSTFTKLVRVVAYCLRWLNLRNQNISCGVYHTVSFAELSYATKVILRLVQAEEFSKVIEYVCSTTNDDRVVHKFKSLHPFVDSDGLLRVGGRLENSPIGFDQKHPIILPKGHPVVELYLRSEHVRLLHAGTQTVLANVRQKYWPIGGRNAIKKIINKCLKCARFKAANAEQLMGNLPTDRVTKQRPFQIVGVDFAGPVILRTSRLRKAPRTKAYIALFVCMVTKAVHIDITTRLSTESFLATLHRFVSRRGYCSVIHSDNGKNFVGASKELRQLYRYFKRDESKKELITASAQLGILWKFILSYSPHFGGLWEGSIKRMKHHIRRVIGSHCLTYEEYQTVLIQIEAILNSRPLLTTTDDVTDASYISPAHFLIGEPLTTIPEPFITETKGNANSKLIKQMATMRDSFWSTWSKQYLSLLQKRNKWFKTNPNLNKDTIVLVKEDNVPPLQWQLGKIVEVIKGQDGKVRVVTIKTNTGTHTRPITKVVPLPCE